MGLYSRIVLPRIIDLGCRQRPIEEERAKLVPRARGRVLEVGIGSGLNLPHYDPKRVEAVCGIDPSDELWRTAEERAREASFAVQRIARTADDLTGGRFDTAVITFTLCSIPDPVRALASVASALEPDGELLFAEHGRAPDEGVRRWQDRLTPIWRRLGGGCHLNRPIPSLIESGGFEIVEIESRYLPGWKPASYVYRGVARPLQHTVSS